MRPKLLYATFRNIVTINAELRMKTRIFERLGHQLRSARTARNMTQPALAQRIGRDRARISDLERDLIGNRLGRDRLTLLADICDALDLEPVLVPRANVAEIMALLGGTAPRPQGGSSGSTFDEVFVDLSDPSEDE